ncbi:glycosyltransferase family 2 protein [Campylobacter sp. MIT 12-8780]|uniref:glycosyltransferase family 2 protein n=1 Tax=unclassified Campylobacter TaxID=2593542 RepID=UPI00115D53F8|nr:MULTISPECIES: glycosyltransferase [unclassified Campylobacter]NDJ26881.1 glycosyltransferase [Campylobacter sp. MIT 19-121]TQR41975.1 glycosyltransferase family 2 protein [Campylobacter sp. MIT 12-8780]
MTNKEAKVGIVVPIYNIEKYLKACIESVLKQSYSNFELLLVNDGSTDKSFDIAFEYAKKDKRITLIDKKNAGQGSARNVGIEYFSETLNFYFSYKKENLACFKLDQDEKNDIYALFKKTSLPKLEISKITYICFFDGDDFLALNCLEEAVKNIKNYNVLWFDYQPYFDGVKAKKTQTQMQHFAFTQKSIISTEEWLQRARSLNIVTFWFAWQGMIAFEFLKDTKIHFVEKSFTEDVHFGIALFAEAQKIVVLPQKLYYYRIRPKSSMNHSRKKADIQLSTYCNDFSVSYKENLELMRQYQEAFAWLQVARALLHFTHNFKDKELARQIEELFLPYVCNKALVLELLDPQTFKKELKELKKFIKTQPYGAIERTKEYLSYKLAKECNKAKGLKKLVLPFKFIKILCTHKKRSNLKRPECYKDYIYALKMKNKASIKRFSNLGAKLSSIKNILSF